MRRLAFLFIGITLMPIPAWGAPAPKISKEELIKEELAKLEGTWEIVYYHRDGEEYSAEDLALLPKVLFKGDEFQYSLGGHVRKIYIDPTASPKTMDHGMGLECEKTIYVLDGDTFIQCMDVNGSAAKPRPKDFVVKGKERLLMKCKRVKE
ncbi:MAG: TIGR03067 domain-containing protein [Planctomycetes bacterium]|nr:TIGR03067 domain-containing protein [Planctomycetota bacterium]